MYSKHNKLFTLGAIITGIIAFFTGNFYTNSGTVLKESNFNNNNKQSLDVKDIASYVNTLAYRVIDGDTIQINSVDGSIETKQYARLVCIDAPETGQSPWGVTSAKKLSNILRESKVVAVQRLGTDRYKRALVLLSTQTIDEGSFSGNVQKELVKNGLAYVYHSYKANCPIYHELVDLENDARSKGIGVWSSPDNVPPWEYRKNQIRQN